MNEYSAYDNGRLITFTGELLATASSRRDDRERWSETNIYRNLSGGYVVVKLGMSAVPGESTRSRVHVSGTAIGAIESLTQVDDDDVRFIRRVDRMAILQAIERDEPLKNAYVGGVRV